VETLLEEEIRRKWPALSCRKNAGKNVSDSLRHAVTMKIVNIKYPVTIY
jgi:hypothetical protein